MTFVGLVNSTGCEKRPSTPLKVTYQPTLQSSFKASGGCVCDRLSGPSAALRGFSEAANPRHGPRSGVDLGKSGTSCGGQSA